MRQHKENSVSLIVIIPALILNVITLLFQDSDAAPAAVAPAGTWSLVQKSIGVSAMHMQLLYTDHVVVFDRTDFGKSNLSLPNGKCRESNETALRIDCTAHSVEFHVITNTLRPLTVQTDVWCSSGSAVSDGTLVQTGGFQAGERRVRTFSPCFNGRGCDWNESELGLAVRRWYATNQILPDGRQIIVGGRRQHNYEFYPKSERTTERSLFNLRFLAETNDLKIENNLYPFVFLNVDGNLFVFANNRAILLDYVRDVVVRSFPEIPGGDPRSYPSTGSAVLLPLTGLDRSTISEVLVCGGAPKGSFAKANNETFVEALKTCARIRISDPNPVWVLEEMPVPRVMGDMTLLANGDVLIINGCSNGTAGWELGRGPVLNPVLYRPGNKIGSRFYVQNPTTVPRMYHSTAVLLRDGRVLIGGSNPHVYYNFTAVNFPTDLSLEAFSPGYLDRRFAGIRPRITSPENRRAVKYGEKVVIRFSVSGVLAGDFVKVTMVFPSFTTHSFSMNQRVLVLPTPEKVRSLGSSVYEVTAAMPGSAVLAPAGYYLLFVVHRDIPSDGIWVHMMMN